MTDDLETRLREQLAEIIRSSRYMRNALGRLFSFARYWETIR